MFIKIWVHEKIYINEMQTIRNIIRDIRRMMQIFYPRSFCVRNIIIHCYDLISYMIVFWIYFSCLKNFQFEINIFRGIYLQTNT